MGVCASILGATTLFAADPAPLTHVEFNPYMSDQSFRA